MPTTRMMRCTLIAMAVLALLSCAENPSLPGRDNVLDQQNHESGGDPFALAARVGASAVTLTWQAIEWPALHQYRIFRRVGVAGPLHALDDVSASTTSFDDLAIDGGETYQYKVGAVSRDGIVSDVSRLAAVTVHSLAVFSIDNGAAETSTRDVTINIRAASCDSIWVWNGSAADSAGGSWLTKLDDVAELDWRLPGGLGEKVVHARLRYSDGHSEHTSDSIMPATVTPSLVIADGATAVPTTQVQLAIDAENAVEMMISNDSDLSGAAWQTLSPTTSWALSPGEGEKTVYARFRDDFLVEYPAQDSVPLAIARR